MFYVQMAARQLAVILCSVWLEHKNPWVRLDGYGILQYGVPVSHLITYIQLYNWLQHLKW